MTAKKDLKKRIRERMHKTGERYATARARVQANASAPRLVVEQTFSPAFVREVGLACPISIPEAARLGWDVPFCRAAVRRLAEVLRAEGAPRGGEQLQALALRGTPAVLSANFLEEVTRFGAQLGLGVGGVSEHGLLLAYDVPRPEGASERVVALLGPRWLTLVSAGTVTDWAAKVQQPGYWTRALAR